MRRLLIPLLAPLAVAGCGSETTPRAASGETRVTIADARVVTNDASADGIGRRLEDAGDGGIVAGEPSLDDLDASAPPPAAVEDQRAGCSGTGLDPIRAQASQVAAATLCLLNAERRTRNLRPLRSNGRLARAALAHARDMVDRSYFSHDSPAGASVADRVNAAGYIRRRDRWAVGENLAWGTGSRATPSEIVQAWMESPGHKANILRADFRQIGIAIAVGTPQRGVHDGATYNTVFGVRRRA